MANPAKEGKMRSTLRSADREISDGFAYWAGVRARLSDTD